VYFNSVSFGRMAYHPLDLAPHLFHYFIIHGHGETHGVAFVLLMFLFLTTRHNTTKNASQDPRRRQRGDRFPPHRVHGQPIYSVTCSLMYELAQLPVVRGASGFLLITCCSTVLFHRTGRLLGDHQALTGLSAALRKALEHFLHGNSHGLHRVRPLRCR
jgi:hypothetical protein